MKKPDHIDSYLGLIQIRLDEQDVINEKISDLVMSNKRSDNELREKLENQKLNLYKECASLCENILQYDPENRSALKYLSQFYYFLDRLDDRKINETNCMAIYGLSALKFK